LGIDYGTSYSKTVVRDFGAPGGERAYLVPNSWRIPSAVAVTGGEFVFGASPATLRTGDAVWHDSVKMRVAGEEVGDLGEYCVARCPAPPPGYGARDIAALTVWHVISVGDAAIREHLIREGESYRMQFTMGAPASFLDSDALTRPFLDIARVAWQLLLQNGPMKSGRISIEHATMMLARAKASIQTQPYPEGDDVRDWLRSEAEAALAHPLRATHIEDGRYVQIDIGAGTTNLSVLGVGRKFTEEGWVNSDSISCYAAGSTTTGMDAIDRAIASRLAAAPASPLDLRGKESDYIDRRSAPMVLRTELGNVKGLHRRCLAEAFSRGLQARAERERWREHKLIFIGGGSLIKPFTDNLTTYPLDGFTHSLSATPLEVPDDLVFADGREVPALMLPFVYVAYGLSFYAWDAPRLDPPNAIEPMRTPAASAPVWYDSLDPHKWANEK